MDTNTAIVRLTELSRASEAVFRGRDAVAIGVTRKRLAVLHRAGVIARELRDVYRLTVVEPSSRQRLQAALLWAGATAAADGLSAVELYGMEGVRAERPEIAVSEQVRARSAAVVAHRIGDPAVLMIRTYRGLRVVGVERALVSVADRLPGERFEIACEDARRRRLTTVAALRAYLARFGSQRLPGATTTRALLDHLDPIHPARSTLEVKTRRLLVANGIRDFRREVAFEWRGRIYRFDFVLDRTRTILETNGRRWHDDPLDYEHDNEKWSVPAHHGYRLVFATWDKVTRRSAELIEELGGRSPR
jgi:very-short-patch-repair endonuclease